MMSSEGGLMPRGGGLPSISRRLFAAPVCISAAGLHSLSHVRCNPPVVVVVTDPLCLFVSACWSVSSLM